MKLKFSLEDRRVFSEDPSPTRRLTREYQLFFSVEEMLEAAEMAEQAELQQTGDVSNEVIV